MLKDQVALVTGASSGIGRASAESLARLGARVAVNYYRNRDGADETVETIKKAGGDAVAVQADVTSSSAVGVLADTVRRQWGRVDILVNNAGDIVARQSLGEMTEEYWDQVMAVNLKSAFLCVKAVWEQMVARKSGCIINVTSVSARNGGGPGAAAYSAAKGGLLTYTKSLAKELGPLGIRVNAVAPGVIITPFHRHSSAETIQKWIAGIPLGRTGAAEEVAGVIAFLASPAAAYIHGETIEINGGMWMD
ncbi:MAG: SDR family NAD(P)-dependent oxidoreductase [Bryobacteraceae bacterium]